MKRLLVIFSLVLTLLLAGCNTSQHNQQGEKGDFMFYSLEWGADWETVQKNETLQNVKCDVTEDGPRQLVKIKDLEYLGVKSDMVGLIFDTNGVGNTPGLVTVIVQFEEEYEKTLLTKLEELYGERKNTYIDKNGVGNPINPAGWVSNDTIEEVLTVEEKEYYLDMFPKGYEQRRIDALLRSPLVSIRFDEDHNLIEFNGNHAAIVSYIQAELKK